MYIPSFEKSCFVNKYSGSGYEEYCNIQPIRRLAYNSVISIEKQGDQYKPCKYPSELYAPEIRISLKKTTLHKRKYKKRKI